MKSKRSPKGKQSSILGYLSLPFLFLFPPKPDQFLIDDLDWEHQHQQKTFNHSQTSSSKIFKNPVLLDLCPQDFLFDLFDVRVIKEGTLKDLVVDDSMIGIVGDQKMTGLSELDVVQVMTINPESEIPTLTCIRPYSFSAIFITNAFACFPRDLMFTCRQTFSIRLNSKDQLQETLRLYEKHISSEQGECLLQNIKEKLKIKVSIINGDIWVTLNELNEENHLENYVREKLKLRENQEKEIVQSLTKKLKVSELLELIHLRNEQPEELNLAIMSLMKRNAEKKLEGSKIMVERSSESQQMDKGSPEQSSFQLFGPFDEIVMKEEEIESPRKRFRSKSADISEEKFRQQVEELNMKLLEELGS